VFGAKLLPERHWKTACARCQSEEAAVGLTHVVPFLFEDELISLGAVFSKVEKWGVHTVVDGPAQE